MRVFLQRMERVGGWHKSIFSFLCTNRDIVFYAGKGIVLGSEKAPRRRLLVWMPKPRVNHETYFFNQKRLEKSCSINYLLLNRQILPAFKKLIYLNYSKLRKSLKVAEFLVQWLCFSNSPKKSPDIWLRLKAKFVIKTLKSSPISSHWLAFKPSVPTQARH